MGAQACGEAAGPLGPGPDWRGDRPWGWGQGGGQQEGDRDREPGWRRWGTKRGDWEWGQRRERGPGKGLERWGGGGGHSAPGAAGPQCPYEKRGVAESCRVAKNETQWQDSPHPSSWPAAHPLKSRRGPWLQPSWGRDGGGAKAHLAEAGAQAPAVSWQLKPEALSRWQSG